MSTSLSELRRVFEAATANIDKVSFTITAVPETREDLVAVLAVARAAGQRSGAALRRIELPMHATQSFGGNFGDIPVTDAAGSDVLRLFFEREAAKLDAAA
jgi:hypothetical protein